MLRTVLSACVFAVAAWNPGWVATGAVSEAGEKGKDGKKEEKSVRPLKFAAKDVSVIFAIGGQSKLTRLEDAEAVAKLLGDKGKAEAKALAAQVDFKKEALVLVSWTTSGPPDGVLKYEIKDKQIIFFVQGPPAGGARGQRARIGADFFAVPRDAKVTFEPKERR